MRRFQFRFQRLLEIKGRVEDARKAALGEAVGAYEAERRELERLGELRQAHIGAERARPGQAVDPGLLSLFANYGRRLEREAGEQGEQTRLANALVDEKRDHLMAATRERRVFEILRERAESAHKKTARRQERAELDEVGGQLHLRRQRAARALAASPPQDEAWPTEGIHAQPDKGHSLNGHEYT